MGLNSGTKEGNDSTLQNLNVEPSPKWTQSIELQADILKPWN